MHSPLLSLLLVFCSMLIGCSHMDPALPAAERTQSEELDAGDAGSPSQDDILSPCESHPDCSPGSFCIWGGTTGICAPDCVEICGEDADCIPLGLSLVCTPATQHPNLCRPCFADDDCRGESEAEAKCIAYGIAGQFCGSPCTGNSDCPEGYSCGGFDQNPEGNEGYCMILGGTCSCTPDAIAEKAATPCRTLDTECTGVRWCTPDGLSHCTVGLQEQCDGIDNDCDGLTDNGLEGCDPVQLEDEDGDGVAIAHGDCNDRNPAIHPGAGEICDGINNDCDSEIDEELPQLACSIENEFGACGGSLDCIEGTSFCDGPEPNVCGTCTPLPNLYGKECGCGGKIDCDGACQGSNPAPCAPISCFTGNGEAGIAGCPGDCSSCSNAPWRVCHCSANPGAPSLILSPDTLTTNLQPDLFLWVEDEMNPPFLRINTVHCITSEAIVTCENPDACGGFVWHWSALDSGLFQLGNNVIEVLRNDGDDPCNGGLEKIIVRGFFPFIL